jgi:hypothetical protein
VRNLVSSTDKTDLYNIPEIIFIPWSLSPLELQILQSGQNRYGINKQINTFENGMEKSVLACILR